MSLARHPPTAVQQHLHESDHACVVDLDAGELRGSDGDRQRQTLQKRKVDVDVEALGLETSEAVRHLNELLPHGVQMIQAFLQPKVGEVVRANLVAQKRGKLLILLDEGVLPVRAKDVMAVFDLFQRRVQFPLQLLRDPAAEDLGDLVGRHAP